jgi:cyclase
MFRPRVIPVLLLRELGLVKSVKFKRHQYIGDPINAVKIFNEKKADELIFLDILASKENRCISLDFVRKVGDEASMPFAVGGGIRSNDDIRELLNNGAEKVILNSVAFENPKFVKEATDTFGSSTIGVCIDVKKNFFGKERIAYYSGSKLNSIDLIEYAQLIAEYGAGELIIQSVDRDGTYEGYDLNLITKISRSVTIPVIALGGAGSYSDFYKAVSVGNASAVAAGSIFVYHGPRRAVLISFPSQRELSSLFSNF